MKHLHTIPDMIRAIQELQKRTIELSYKINELENKLEAKPVEEPVVETASVFGLVKRRGRPPKGDKNG